MATPLHEFDGEQLTTIQIQTRVPCLSIYTVRKYLSMGMNTKAKMLAHDTVAERRRHGTMSAAAARARGNTTFSVARNSRDRAAQSGYVGKLKP